MLKKTNEKMIEYAQSLKPGTDRAKAYSISDMNLRGRTIAEALCDANVSDHALRAAALMVRAGAAIEEKTEEHCYGKFTFEDGSELE